MSPYDNPEYWAMVRHIRDVDRAGGDSTLARLVTADWLQDHGEEARATYIRWRCDAPTPFSHATGDGAGSVVLFDPEGEPVEVELAPRHPGVQFDSAGGWVVSARCPFAWWLQHGPDLCRRHPVRGVVITDFGPEACQWAQRQYDTVAVSMAVDGEFLTTPAVRFALALARHFSPNFLFVPGETANRVAHRWAEFEADHPAPSEATR